MALQSTLGEPVADDVLHVEAAAGVDEQALAVAAAEHGERGGGGAEHRHAVDARRGAADPPRDGFGLAESSAETMIAARRPKGGIAGLAPGLGLGGVEAVGVAGDQGGDHRRVGLVGLDQDAARLVAAAGAAGDLRDLLEAALGGAQVAAGKAEVGIDHADQGEVGEMIALGDELGADDDVDLARLHRADELGRLGGDQIVSEVTIAVRASGKSAATSSAIRSTPGPQATRLSSSPHSGQALGGGMTWPQWWQARRWMRRCSTIQAVQLGHWKRWPQWRHRVSGA